MSKGSNPRHMISDAPVYISSNDNAPDTWFDVFISSSSDC